MENNKLLPCPHGRWPMNGSDGWKHCPHCLGINSPLPKLQNPIKTALLRIAEAIDLIYPVIYEKKDKGVTIIKQSNLKRELEELLKDI